MFKIIFAFLIGYFLCFENVHAASLNAKVDEVYPIRTVRIENNERPRGWLNPISPIPVVHRSTVGREAASTLFLGVPRGSIDPHPFDPVRFFPPAKLVDAPDQVHETRDSNLMNATLGIYAHSRDKRTFWGRKLTFNRVIKSDTYVRFDLGYPLNSDHADSLVRAELNFEEVSAENNTPPGCQSAVSDLMLVRNPTAALFETLTEESEGLALEDFEAQALIAGTDYTRISDNQFDITNVVRNWMRSSPGSIVPMGLILIGAEHPRATGLGSTPTAKHRKRRHKVRWLRVGDYRFDRNEWEFICYHNAKNLKIELEF